MYMAIIFTNNPNVIEAAEKEGLAVFDEAIVPMSTEQYTALALHTLGVAQKEACFKTTIKAVEAYLGNSYCTAEQLYTKVAKYTNLDLQIVQHRIAHARDIVCKEKILPQAFIEFKSRPTSYPFDFIKVLAKYVTELKHNSFIEEPVNLAQQRRREKRIKNTLTRLGFSPTAQDTLWFESINYAIRRPNLIDYPSEIRKSLAKMHKISTEQLNKRMRQTITTVWKKAPTPLRKTIFGEDCKKAPTTDEIITSIANYILRM